MKSKHPRRPYITVKHGMSVVTKKPYWRFRIHAGNHKIIAWSETYSSRRAVRRGIQVIHQNIPMMVNWL